MAENVEMQGIEFQIVNDSDAASDGLNRLSQALKSVKTSLGGAGSSLSRTSAGIGEIKKALEKLNTGDFSAKLKRISDGIAALGASASSAKLSSSIGTQLQKIGEAINTMPEASGQKLATLADGLRPLTELGKAKLTSFITQFGKLPDVIKELEAADIDKFSKQMKELAESMRPFADEMNKVSAGFSAFPSRIQRVITATEEYNRVIDGTSKKNTKLSNSFGSLFKRLGIVYLLKQAIEKATEYQETLNLFTVSMGRYGEAAFEYAQKVSDVMGIDPAEWMKNQGVFQTIITGFGVAGDKAALMSKNLTQLAYDLSSFYNIGTTEAFQKVQSGISGELEPMRRLGYDLSVARLEQERLNLGIAKSVSEMTQAEKSQLRYYAMLTQVTEAQGDMARTLDAPANQLRILKAQLEQAARAIGDLFIPMLKAILPPAIAVVKALREIIAHIAELFGIEMQAVDWSGADAGSGTISDNLDDAANSAKELKRYLAGFDELNVLPSQNDSSYGNVGSGFNIEIPSYDFIGDAISEEVDRIYDSLKKIITPIKKVINIVYSFRKTIATALILTAVTKLWKKVHTVWQSFTGLKTVKTFVDGFKEVKTAGGNTFSSINGGLESIRNSLSGLQKFGITAITGALEFVTVRSAVYDLASGCEDAASKVTAIGVAATVAAGAMYVALGPAGIAIAAITGIIAAFVGAQEAARDTQKAFVENLVFNDVGISLDEIKEKFEKATEQITIHCDKINDWANIIESNNGKISSLKDDIDVFTETMGTDGAITSEEVDKLKEKFSELYAAVQSNMENSANIINEALVQAMKNATPEISEQISLMIGEYQRYVRETQGKAAELKLEIENAYDSLVGLSKASPEYKEKMEEISKLYSDLGILTGEISDTSFAWQRMKEDIANNKIDLGGDIETAKEKLREIGAVGKEALEAIDDAKFNTLKEIQNQINKATLLGDTEQVAFFENMKDLISKDYDNRKAEIETSIKSVFDQITAQFAGKTVEVKERLEEEWGNMGYWDQFLNGATQMNYVHDGLQQLRDMGVEIGDEMNGILDELGIDGEAKAGTVMSRIFDSLFSDKLNHQPGGLYYHSYEWQTDINDAVKNALEEVGLSGSESSKTAGEKIGGNFGWGITSGIEGTVEQSKREMVALVDDLDETVRKAAGIHSPSTLFATDGAFMAEGLVYGFRDELKNMTTDVNSYITAVFDTKDAYSVGYSYGEALGRAIADAIRNIQYPTVKGSMTTSNGSSEVSFKAYADGGFVDAGQLFIAREAGAEMVGSIGGRTAVANNDQIVTAVSSGVYRAVTEALAGRDSASRDGSQVVSAKVNEKTLFEVILDYARGETVRTGENPFLEL